MANSELAAYLLRYYPVLWEQSQSLADDALSGGSNKDPKVNRKAEGIHSDPTAKKAVLLYQARALADRLDPVRVWVDERLPPKNRKLLIAVWRVGGFGWRRIARESGYHEVVKCRRSWEVLVEDLASQL